MSQLISIFRTKEEIMLAEQRGNVKIDDGVLINPNFKGAGLKDLLGFKVREGSDFTVVDVKSIKNNPSAFMEMAFGEVESNGSL